MASYPAIPFWTDAYLGDTRHLSTLEHGAYFLLLMCAWRTPSNDLPDDDKQLARMCGMRIDQWRRIRPTILAMWQQRDDGRWAQKRLDMERNFVHGRSQKQSGVAIARWLKVKETRDATAMPDACQIDTPTPTPREKNNDATASLSATTNGATHHVNGLEPSASPVRQASRSRGSRLPDDWQPDGNDRMFAEHLGLEAGAIAEQFRDYWHSKPGANATKLDWSAAWRNWCRRSAGEPRSHRNGLAPAGQRQPRNGPVSINEAAADVLALFEQRKSRSGGV